MVFKKRAASPEQIGQGLVCALSLRWGQQTAWLLPFFLLIPRLRLSPDLNAAAESAWKPGVGSPTFEFEPIER